MARLDPPPSQDAVLGFRFDILVHGESRWASNQLRFADEEAALVHAHGMSSRWVIIEKIRIVPQDAPKGEPYIVGSEHPDWVGPRVGVGEKYRRRGHAGALGRVSGRANGVTSDSSGVSRSAGNGRQAGAPQTPVPTAKDSSPPPTGTSLLTYGCSGIEVNWVPGVAAFIEVTVGLGAKRPKQVAVGYIDVQAVACSSSARICL